MAPTFRSHHACQRARRSHAGIGVSGMGGGVPSAGMLSMLTAAVADAVTLPAHPARLNCRRTCHGAGCRLGSLTLCTGRGSTCRLSAATTPTLCALSCAQSLPCRAAVQPAVGKLPPTNACSCSTITRSACSCLMARCRRAERLYYDQGHLTKGSQSSGCSNARSRCYATASPAQLFAISGRGLDKTEV